MIGTHQRMLVSGVFLIYIHGHSPAWRGRACLRVLS